MHQAIIKASENQREPMPLSNHENSLQFYHILYIFIVVTKIALQFLHSPHTENDLRDKTHSKESEHAHNENNCRGRLELTP